VNLKISKTMEPTSLNVSLPKALKDYVEMRIRNGGYSTASEYVRELIREDQRRQAMEKLELLLVEGATSGTPIEATPEFWKKKQREFARRHHLKTR
jgi:antitoxin ParD1/3/4